VGFNGAAEAVYAALNADGGGLGVSFRDFALLDCWFRADVASPSFGSSGVWGYHTLRPFSGARRAGSAPASRRTK
jgi:hypothetical protein